MSNLDLVWDNANRRGDWVVASGALRTGNLLKTAVLVSLFTDRVAQPDYQPDDGSADRRGWWSDSFDGVPIGSRLWQLRRRKIASRPLLIVEAEAMCREALAWMQDDRLVEGLDVRVASAPAGAGSSGNLLAFEVELFAPAISVPLVRALWSAV